MAHDHWNKFYFEPISYSQLSTYVTSFVNSDCLEDKKYVKHFKKNKLYHLKTRDRINLIENDLFDQIIKDQISCSLFVIDSNKINKLDYLENNHLKNEKFIDKIDRKNSVKDRCRDKGQIKDKNKDLKCDLKDEITHHNYDLKARRKDHKDESIDKSKHHNNEKKNKSVSTLKNKDSKFEIKYTIEHKYDLEDIDHNSKIKRGHKCMLKDINSKSKISTKDNDSKMRNYSAKSARSESKWNGTDIVNSTDDGSSKKEHNCKSECPEIRRNVKETILIALEPKSPLGFTKEEEIILFSEREENRNINRERRQKAKRKHDKQINRSFSLTPSKNRLVCDNSQTNIIPIVVGELLEISRKQINKNHQQTRQSVLVEVLNRWNHKLKRSSLSTSTDPTDIIGKAETQLKNDKIIEHVINLEGDNKKKLLNSENVHYECKDDDKKCLDSISVRDIYKTENMIEYEMDMKKRFLKKMESNRKRTQISMLGNSSLSEVDGHNERNDLLPPEVQCTNGIIKTSNLSENKTKYKTLNGKLMQGSISDLIKMCENEDTKALCRRLATKMLMRSKFDKTQVENIFDECLENSNLHEKNKNSNRLSQQERCDRGNIQINAFKPLNRGKKRVSFATKCALIYQNPTEDTTEKLASLKYLKKIIHDLSNKKINKAGLKKKKSILNKKTRQYSSKLLKLFRNRSMKFAKEKHFYDSIKKKPKIGEKPDTRIKSNNSPWSFKNNFNLDRFLPKQSQKPIKKEKICENELKMKETKSAIRLSNNLISLDDLGRRIHNLTLRSNNIHSNQFFQNNNLIICSASSINKKEIEETACIMLENTNQVNYGCQNDFHFPLKDDNLKRINDSTINGSISKTNLFPKSNLINNENVSSLKFHRQDHNVGGLFPDSPYEVKTGSVRENINVELPEKNTSYCSQTFLKPERPFLKEIKRNNFIINNNLRKNNGVLSYYGEKFNDNYNLTNNSKNNKFLRQKRLRNRKNFGNRFGKKVKSSSYDSIYSKSMRLPNISRLDKDCSDQILPKENKKKVAKSIKNLNSFLHGNKLPLNRSGDENTNSPKIVIKDSDISLLEIKISNKLIIDVCGSEIKVERFGNNDGLKGLTIVNHNNKKDDMIYPGTKLHKSNEKGMQTETQESHKRKFNHNSVIIKLSKTLVDKSSWTGNDYVLHKVKENNDCLTVDKNGKKPEKYSGNPSTFMVDVGTDCFSNNQISTLMENVESKGGKHSEIVPNYGSSNLQNIFEKSNTQPNRNHTIIEYKIPDNNKFKDKSMNILKTRIINNNKGDYNKFKKDFEIDYEKGVICFENQMQKSTSVMDKAPNFIHHGEVIKVIEPLFRMRDENLAATISNRSTINNNIEDRLNISNSDMKTDNFDLSALNISLPEQEIKYEPVLLSNLKKCNDISAPIIPKKSTKIRGSDRKIFTYILKKIKTLISRITGKFKPDISST